MNEEIELENSMREENSQKLVKKLGDEIGKFHEMLGLERKVRLIVYKAVVVEGGESRDNVQDDRRDPREGNVRFAERGKREEGD